VSTQVRNVLCGRFVVQSGGPSYFPSSFRSIFFFRGFVFTDFSRRRQNSSAPSAPSPNRILSFASSPSWVAYPPSVQSRSPVPRLVESLHYLSSPVFVRTFLLCFWGAFRRSPTPRLPDWLCPWTDSTTGSSLPILFPPFSPCSFHTGNFPLQTPFLMILFTRDAVTLTFCFWAPLSPPNPGNLFLPPNFLLWRSTCMTEKI